MGQERLEMSGLLFETSNGPFESDSGRS